MKKYSPYILPAIVMGVVLLLVFRWYSNRTQPVSQGELFGEGVQIEDLSDTDAREVMTSTASTINTVQLEPGDEAGDGLAMVRYELKEDKVRFSVIANVEATTEPYQVWLKEVGGDSMRKAFMLESGKGGYVGSAALPANLLPFEVVISTATDAANALAHPLYSGIIGQTDQE